MRLHFIVQLMSSFMLRSFSCSLEEHLRGPRSRCASENSLLSRPPAVLCRIFLAGLWPAAFWWLRCFVGRQGAADGFCSNLPWSNLLDCSPVVQRSIDTQTVRNVL
jgi:hypothetical protein